MPLRFQGIDNGILFRNGAIRMTDVHKHAIVAVNACLPQRFIIDWNEALVFFPRTFGNQLFQPGPQIIDSGRGDERDLVATGLGQRPQNRPQRDSGIVRGGHARLALLTHAFGPMQKRLDVHAHRGGRHHAEVGQGRIASSDIRHTRENRAKLEFTGQAFQLRIRIGNRDKMLAGAVALDPLHPFKKVFLEHQRFGSRTGLARHDTQRPFEIDFFFKTPHLRGNGTIQHVQFRIAGDDAEGHPEHFRTETAAAHAQQEDMGKPGGFNFIGKRLQL